MQAIVTRGRSLREGDRYALNHGTPQQKVKAESRFITGAKPGSNSLTVRYNLFLFATKRTCVYLCVVCFMRAYVHRTPKYQSALRGYFAQSHAQTLTQTFIRAISHNNIHTGDQLQSHSQRQLYIHLYRQLTKINDNYTTLT